jgi:methylthioribose-1-phosphate isomerase
MALDNIPRTIWWEDGKVRMIDQNRLPLVGDVLECDTAEGVCWAVKTLAVRGAPALGVAAALALALWAQNETDDIETVDDFLIGLDEVIEYVVASRPTAVNLAWGAHRMRKLAHQNADLSLDELKDLMVQEAENMIAEDEARNRKIGEFGASLLKEESRILTHCNAGSLATAYFGTALGVIFTAHEQGKIAHVWVDETRPVLQGARLTAWELLQAEIPCALITDNMAGWVMQQGAVDAIIVGADRIAANGDVANKIGTYSLAVLAKHHDIPFYVAAPSSTVDLLIGSGEEISIEQRPAEEVLGTSWSAQFEPPNPDAAKLLDKLTEEGAFDFHLGRGHQLMLTRRGAAYQFDGWARTAPTNVPVYNPAFDVTPNELVTAIILETGIVQPPYEQGLAVMTMGSGGIHELYVE